MSLGLFDVLGPIMHGPSSNHTGGANRIGYYARQIMGETPERIELGFHPGYLDSYRGQHSHIALIAGCLGYREYDDESTDSIRLAKAQNLTWSVKPISETEMSRNTMRVTGWIGGDRYVVNAVSVGGGNILVDAINGLSVHLTGNEYALLLIGGNDALLGEAAAAVTRLATTGDPVQGFGMLGDQALCCIASNAPLPGIEDLPEKLRQTVLSGELTYRKIDPLYPFRDSGEAPLVATFEQAIAACQAGDFSELALRYEEKRSGVTREKILAHGAFLTSVIRDALKKAEEEEIETIGGLTEQGDGRKLLAYARSGNTVVNETFTKGLARAVMLAEMNAAACRIVACPTGGAAGALPGALFTAAERYGADEDRLIRAFLVAALIGVIIGNKASFSGTVGGCQSEVGIGAAMGAGAIAYLAGGSPDEIVQAAAIALKNILGLTCDPPASPTEVPCIKRNAMGVAIAFFGADMGLAGIRSAIAPDDVVSALRDTQERMPMELKFSHIGGLAATESGKDLKKRWEEKLKSMKS